MERERRREKEVLKRNYGDEEQNRGKKWREFEETEKNWGKVLKREE